ncbi:MAG TPA: DUF2155 domain-containing protein [Stellaceae bacterium]
MARSSFYRSLLTAAALAVASPALAQFGSIFRDDGPPRPPANVPEQAPYYSPQQRQLPPSQQPYYPSRGDVPPPPQYQQPTYQQPQVRQPQYQPPQYQQRPIYTQEPDDERDAPRPPGSVQRGDVPPAQPMPPPMSLPPSSRPGGGGIQTQDLAPLPGAPQAPADQRPQPQQSPQQATTPPNATPGQQPQPGQPGQPGAPQEATQPPPSEEVVVEPPPQRIANPTAVFSGLDKITGRIISFDVALNETVQFGALQVTPRVCYSRPPTETPNTDAFVEVDEVTLQGEIKRIFTGWMFAASPGLHAVEHPIYDVWLTDCKGAQNPAVAEVPAEEQPKPAAKPPARPAPGQRRPAARQPRAQQQPAGGTLPALR